MSAMTSEMANSFEIDSRLAGANRVVADWPLCRVLLINDARFPWLILVPRKDGLRDFDDVAAEDKPAFYAEIERATRALRRCTAAPKMNVASLGNLVPQLHVHIIARFPGDAAWPGAVWGVGEPEPYDTGAAEKLAAEFVAAAGGE